METTTDPLTQVSLLLRSVVSGPDAVVLSDAELLTRARVAAEAQRLLDTVLVQVAAEVAVRSRPELGAAGLAARNGERSAAGLLARVTRVSEQEARRRMRVGAAIAGRQSLTGEPLPAEFEHLAVAFREGVVGVESAESIIRCLRPAARTASVQDRDAAEAFLVGQAMQVSADLVVVQARVWREALDPDGAKPREDALTGERAFWISPDRPGLPTKFGGATDPVNAAFLRAVFDKYLSPRRKPAFLDDENTLDGIGIGDGDGDDGGGGERVSRGEADDPADGCRSVSEVEDPRSREQRAHDILFGVLKAGIGAEEVGVPKHSITTIIATVTQADLDTGQGTGWLEGVAEPVSAQTLQEKLCDASFRRLVLGGEGEILHLGPDVRLFQPAQRIAISTRDGGCVFPGCAVPPSWCEVHHVIPYSKGGPTDVDNGALLCAFHHHVIHNSPWQLRMIRGRPQMFAPPWLNPARAWQDVGLARAGLVAARRRRC